jgi:predicted transglutaminase-like cysteine proteinase
LLASCVATIFLALPPVAAATAFNDGLFGYSESVQPDSGAFAQWTQVLERRLLDDATESDCQAPTFNPCHRRNWLAFLDTLRARPPGEQIAAVNRYANRKRYVLDLDNYGVEDYWAIPREFLYNNGDCEDYAITKLFSLRWLGFGTDRLRIVVLQDTNLRIPHAVLAVDTRNDIVILDNQIQEVVSQHDIVHYSPVYAINEQHWWLYLPELD